MIIAQQKKKENTAEYLLYMWQIEDLIRACNFNMDVINTNLVKRFQADDETSKKIYDWYDNLRVMMQNEHLEEKGHLQINQNVVNELTEYHLFFLQSDDWQYKTTYQNILSIIADLRMRNSVENVQVSDIEICFNLLYMTMIMRMQKKQISEATEKAVKSVSDFIKILMIKVKKHEEEELNKLKN